eukprot:7308539-Ditylum_brightwellii.AAC.1
MEKKICHAARSSAGKDVGKQYLFCLNIEAENRQDPRRQYKYRFPGICYPSQKEIVVSDTFFPSITSRRNVGIPPTLKTDHAQSEVGKAWLEN